MKTLVLITCLICSLGCSGSRQTPPAAPRSFHFDLDASVPIIDYSVYDVPQINISEVDVQARMATPPDGALMTRLDAGDRAPYSGTLFNDLAAAYIIAEYRAVVREHMLYNNITQRMLAGRATADLQHWRASFMALGHTAHIIIQGQDEDYQRLNQILAREQTMNRTSTLSTMLWIGLGTIIGLAAGFGVAGLVAILQ